MYGPCCHYVLWYWENSLHIGTCDENLDTCSIILRHLLLCHLSRISHFYIVFIIFATTEENVCILPVLCMLVWICCTTQPRLNKIFGSRESWLLSVVIVEPIECSDCRWVGPLRHRWADWFINAIVYNIHTLTIKKSQSLRPYPTFGWDITKAGLMLDEI